MTNIGYSISFIIGLSFLLLVIFFLIIKAIISAKRFLDQTRLQNFLLIELLKKNGMDEQMIEHYKSKIK
jgi:hypothetical protein